MSTAYQDVKILTVASCSFVRDEHRSHVVVSGSYGGRYNAFNAAKWGVRGVIMNDAGIGKDNAGICGLEYLDQINLAAATADAQTCHIGDGDHMLEHGIISHVNRAATALGCSPGQSVRECAELMRSAIVPATAPPSFIEGARFVMREVPGEPAVICADSVGMLHPEDAGRIAITASHGALSGGRPDNAIPPAPVRAARPRARVHPVAHHATPGRRAQGCAVAGGQSRANSSLKPNSLLSWENTGNFVCLGLRVR
ncbi:MAG: hypothetical protein WCB44_07475 [Stellaceae bacterium]